MFILEKDTIKPAYYKDTRLFSQYLADLQLKITKYDNLTLEFDLINTDCSIANALRRILMSEIPTMAIEKVTIKDYDGVMPEEIIAHRLGLVPLKVDATLFDFKTDEYTEANTLKFKLKVHNNGPDVMNVYSDAIQWEPLGTQAQRVNVSVKPGILITKLAPKQLIDFEMFAEKNIGAEHAKWSPVCPVSYKMMPVIELGDIYDEEALKLQSLFADKVIGIDCVRGRKKAFVENARFDTASREVLRHEEFKGKVWLGRDSTYFIFSIESLVIDPLILLKQALLILKAKCVLMRKELRKL